GLEDHPLGLVPRLDEGLHDLEALDRALLLLALRRLDDVAERQRLLLEVEVAEQVTDRLRSHPALEVDAEAVGRPEAVLQLTEDLLVADDHLRLELLEEHPRLLEAPDGLDGRLPRVLTPHLHVRDHLADLQRPLADRVEVFLLGPLDEAQVVRELTHLGGIRVGIDRSENIAEQPAAHLARPLEVLAVDVRDERGVLLGQLRAREELLLDLLHVLRDRALLRARRLGEIAAQRSKSCLDLDGRRGHRLDLTRGDTPILASRRLSDELTDAPRVLRRDRLRELDEHT